MGISTSDLMKEKFVLQKTFNELNTKIQTIDKELQVMRNNLNALNGAMQVVDKFLDTSKNEPTSAESKKANDAVRKRQLEIKEKEEAKLLNEGDEGDKWKKISTIF